VAEDGGGRIDLSTSVLEIFLSLLIPRPYAIRHLWLEAMMMAADFGRI